MGEKPVYYLSPVRACDCCKTPFPTTPGTVMYDCKTVFGPWANLDQPCFQKYGSGQLGLGLGQKYERQEDGRFLKVEG